MAQVAGVGMGLLGALFLAAIIFLATGRGSETDALAIFPAWALIFWFLIWRATSWRQTMARGLALLAAEFLAFPLAWLLYQGLPALSTSDPRLPQTLSVLALGLAVAATSLVGGLALSGKTGLLAPGPLRRPLLALGAALFVGEAVYGLILLARLMAG